jgi:hypothetical protein
LKDEKIMRHYSEFKMLKVARLLFTCGRCLVLAMLLCSFPAYAIDYSFPGNLPLGCSQNASSTTEFTCGVTTLEADDTIIVNSPNPIQITVIGALTIGGDSGINSNGKTSDLTLNVLGAFVIGIKTNVNAIVNATAAVTVGANSQTGPITTTAGVVTLGVGSTVNGSIATEAGAVTLGADSSVKGRIDTPGGVVAIGKNGSVALGIKTGAGAITLGDDATVGGSLETPVGVVTLGANAKVGGVITTGAGAVTIGPNSTVGGNITTVAGVVTLTTYVVVGGITTVAGGITVGDHSEICGDVITTGAGVVTVTTNVHIGGRVSSVVGAVTISNGSTVGGNVIIAGGGVMTMTGVNVGGNIGTRAGAITLTNSHIGGSVKISGAGVLTTTGSTVNDISVFVQKGCATTTVVDHYQLSVPVSSLMCLPTPVIVTACATNSNPCTSIASTVNGSATLSSTKGSISAATLTGGVGTASLSYPNAVDGTAVTVSLISASTVAANADTCLGGSCTTIFNTAGFIFTDSANGPAVTLPTQVAGNSSDTYFLRAVKSNTSTQACQAALTGPQSVDLAYQCNNPGSCYAADMMSVNGGTATTIARNNDTGVVNSTPVNLTFDSNGNAPLTFVYSDVGQVKLWASKAASGLLLTDLNGSSNAFVVKPGGFVLSAIQQTALPQLGNPSAVNASGDKFIKAGEAFSVTVTATTTAASGAKTTPSYGRESSPEGVKLIATLVAPVGGLPGTLSGSLGAFTNGVAIGATFAWSEVGIMNLTPRIASGHYLGVAGDVMGTVSGNVGRFTPDHFMTAVTQACLGGDFTYSGQPFAVTVTAMSGGAASGVTQNYDGTPTSTLGYAKNLILSDASVLGVGALAPTAFLASQFTKGVATLSTPIFTFTTAKTVPTAIKLRAMDTDSVTSALNTEGLVQMRSGRIKLANAYGSEKLALPMALRLEYWTARGWIKNTEDTCTLLSPRNFGFSFPVQDNNKLTACDTAITLSGSAPSYLLSLSQSVAGRSGWVDITLNLGATALQPAATQCLVTGGPGAVEVPANLPWLQYSWTGVADNPKARAILGAFKSPLIYRRENY